MTEFHGSGSFTLSRPSLGWHHKKSSLYQQTLVELTNELTIKADDFNDAADAAIQAHKAQVLQGHHSKCVVQIHVSE